VLQCVCMKIRKELTDLLRSEGALDEILHAEVGLQKEICICVVKIEFDIAFCTLGVKFR
jgi:hypothetical protein